MARLCERPDYELADGESDVRGWHVFTREGVRAGEVENVMVSLSSLKACYVEVRLDKDVLRLRESRCVLVPVGAAWLNDDEEIVRLAVSAPELTATPAYDALSFSRTKEAALHRRYRRYLTAPSDDDASCLGGRRRMADTLGIRVRFE
jgi:hypothetical protein